jgi:hypothetical protein
MSRNSKLDEIEILGGTTEEPWMDVEAHKI